MSTYNVTGTHTHNITFVTDQIHSSLTQLVALMGLNRSKLIDDWESTENAIKTWLRTGHLNKVTLEIYDPTDSAYALQRWDMEIDYASGPYLEDLGRWRNKEAVAAAMIARSSGSRTL